MKIFPSIKAKILAFGLSISLIPIAIISTVYYFHARYNLKFDTFQDLKAMAQSKKLHVIDSIHGEEILTSTLSIDWFIEEKCKMITHDKVSKQNVVTSLNKYLLNSLNEVPDQSCLIAITVADKSGNIISSTHEKLIGRNISHREAFIQGINKGNGKTFVGQPHFSSYFDTGCISISAPIIPDDNTKPIGVIINTFSLSFLNDMVTSLVGLGNTGEVYLVSKDTTMVTESRFLKNHPLSQMINTTPIQKIKKGNKEWVGIYLDYRNIPVVGAAMDIPEYSLILVAKIDVSEAFASLKMLNTVVIISGVVCIGVVVGIGCTFAFSTSRPIMDLKNAAERFTKGDLDYRIHMIRNDEIGKLSNSFNIMAEKLSSKINEIKRTAEALRISESKYRLLIDNLPVRISHKNRDSIYISCNESLAKDFCIQPEEITGKTDYDFFPAEISERYRIIDREVIESGQRRDEEIRYNRNGQELIIHTIKVPIKNEKGEITGILDSYIDITEKVNLEREAQQSRHLALIGELAAGVAHEINNPITGVINCAQILLNKSSEGSREKDLGRRIVKEGDRIATIVSKLLSFARTKDKKEKSLTGIQEILPDILTLTEAQLRKESITLKVTIPKDLPGVLANVQEIHQVFLNLINNARYALNQKYSGPHDNKILEIFSEEITVNKRRFIKITFYDHGTGIPAHIRDKIMNPFFTTKPQGKGTGLGLSVCNNIIDDHNGQLNFDSVEGEFTKISIILPVERVRP